MKSKPRRRLCNLIGAALLFSYGGTAAAQTSTTAPQADKAQVMILGVYHFHNPNQDFVKTDFDDHLSAKRQQQIAEVNELLAQFKPTRIALVILLAAVLTASALTQELPAALKGLIQAERDFAKDSVARDIRDSFIGAFADDGIGFQPQPVKVKEDLLKSPATDGPRRGVLNWSPLVAEVSQAEDLGYTTGPFVAENLQTKKQQHGMYSSVWKKQPDGNWKVVLDIGVALTNAVAPLDASVTAPTSIYTDRPLNYEKALQALQAAEGKFGQLADSRGLSTAYKLYAADRMRLHRPQHPPLVSADDIQAWSGRHAHWMKLTALKIESANSGDLGYSYGSYEMRTSMKAEEKGYYAHFWRHFGKEGWRLVLAVHNTLPEQPGKK